MTRPFVLRAFSFGEPDGRHDIVKEAMAGITSFAADQGCHVCPPIIKEPYTWPDGTTGLRWIVRIRPSDWPRLQGFVHAYEAELAAQGLSHDDYQMLMSTATAAELSVTETKESKP